MKRGSRWSTCKKRRSDKKLLLIRIRRRKLETKTIHLARGMGTGVHAIMVGRVGQLDPALYAPGLITQANVTALYDAEPWEDLDLSSVEPLTFDPAESPRLDPLQLPDLRGGSPSGHMGGHAFLPDLQGQTEGRGLGRSVLLRAQKPEFVRSGEAAGLGSPGLGRDPSVRVL